VNRRWFFGPKYLWPITLLVLVGGVALFVYALWMGMKATQ
jgi:hypothetical protein